jgi:bacillithiol system protein YtxJ
MGVFDSLFGRKNETEKKETKTVPWIPLESLDQLDGIIKASGNRTQVIFKHSTSCGISRMVMNMFGSSYDVEAGRLDLYYLDLHAYRSVSNEVAHKFGVMHQSPQLLVIRNGTVVGHASHGAITAMDLERYL